MNNRKFFSVIFLISALCLSISLPTFAEEGEYQSDIPGSVEVNNGGFEMPEVIVDEVPAPQQPAPVPEQPVQPPVVEKPVERVITQSTNEAILSDSSAQTEEQPVEEVPVEETTAEENVIVETITEEVNPTDEKEEEQINIPEAGVVKAAKREYYDNLAKTLSLLSTTIILFTCLAVMVTRDIRSGKKMRRKMHEETEEIVEIPEEKATKKVRTPAGRAIQSETVAKMVAKTILANKKTQRRRKIKITKKLAKKAAEESIDRDSLTEYI